jgi:hypothetical protein
MIEGYGKRPTSRETRICLKVGFAFKNCDTLFKERKRMQRPVSKK